MLWGLKALDTALVGAIPNGMRGRVVSYTVYRLIYFEQLLMLVRSYVGQENFAIFASGDDMRLVIGALRDLPDAVGVEGVVLLVFGSQGLVLAERLDDLLLADIPDADDAICAT